MRRAPAVVSHAPLPLAALGLAIGGLLLGLRVAGPSTDETALGRVTFEIVPSLDGTAEAYVPVADWGLRADAFAAPFRLRLELRALQRQALLDAAGGDRSVLEQARRDLRDGAGAAVWRGIAWSAGATAVLCAVAVAVWGRARRRWYSLPALTAAAFALMAGGSVVVASATFDEAALESPTYYAQGAELDRLLAAAESERVRSAYGSELESVLRSISTVLADQPVRAPAERELFAAADLHANALVIDPLARRFEGTPVLIAGDFAQRGTAAEAQLVAPRVAALGDRVIAVSGNHDSKPFMDRLAAEGVTVLRRRPITVDGLVVAGYPDPLVGKGSDLAGPDRVVTFEDFPDPEARLARAERELREWFDRFSRPPDIVLVHQNALAQSLADSLWRDGYRTPLTIVTGHDHRQHIDRYGSITVVDPGTMGAGGAFEAGERFAGLAALHFAAERPVLGSIDVIEVEPFSGAGRGSRVVVETLCPGEDRCSFEPAEPEITVPVG